MPLIPTLQKEKQSDLYAFEANPVINMGSLENKTLLKTEAGVVACA